ncbi:MAG: molybdopterin-dependent oxidoreductase [Clostridiaceae bacterium]|nr:molybdopterin-dependent oxidoreductase [Clostridiaceae bacterium]
MMKKRGRGIGCNLYGVGYGFNRPDHSAAMIEVADDGSVLILSGACDMGQGSDTAFCQIAAEELGVPYERVRIISGDSDTTPDALASTASRQTFVSGRAVQLAARDAKEHLLRFCGELNDMDGHKLTVVNDQVIVSDTGEVVMDFPLLAELAHQEGKRFIGFAWYDNTTADVDKETNQGDAYACYIYATQVADVEVDTKTGEVTVLRVGAAHDVGKAINPMMCEQQVEGAIAQGVGYAIMEEVILKDGKTLTPSFSKFLIPTVMDVPEMKTYLIESNEHLGPFGAKGVGEGAIIPTAVAVVNAVYDAIGVRIRDLPITPEKILAALNSQKADQ